MSSIRYSLEKLDQAVGQLDQSLSQVEQKINQGYDEHISNVVDVDFVAQRLDKAIATVESLLQEEGEE